MDEDIEKIAQQVSDRIFTKRANDAQLKAQEQAIFKTVDVNSLETKKVRSLGPDFLSSAMERVRNGQSSKEMRCA